VNYKKGLYLSYKNTLSLYIANIRFNLVLLDIFIDFYHIYFSLREQTECWAFPANFFTSGWKVRRVVKWIAPCVHFSIEFPTPTPFRFPDNLSGGSRDVCYKCCNIYAHTHEVGKTGWGGNSYYDLHIMQIGVIVSISFHFSLPWRKEAAAVCLW